MAEESTGEEGKHNCPSPNQNHPLQSMPETEQGCEGMDNSGKVGWSEADVDPECRAERSEPQAAEGRSCKSEECTGMSRMTTKSSWDLGPRQC